MVFKRAHTHTDRAKRGQRSWYNKERAISVRPWTKEGVPLKIAGSYPNVLNLDILIELDVLYNFVVDVKAVKIMQKL